MRCERNGDESNGVDSDDRWRTIAQERDEQRHDDDRDGNGRRSSGTIEVARVVSHLLDRVEPAVGVHVPALSLDHEPGIDPVDA